MLAMSTSLQDMRDRLGAMVVGTSKVFVYQSYSHLHNASLST